MGRSPPTRVARRGADDTSCLLVAGRPDMQLPAWGSYEGWSALVRSAVVWVGLPDPGLTRVVLQDAADTPANCMAVIADCWERMDLERRGLTASEVVDRLRTERENGLDNAPDWHRDLRDSIEAL